MEDDFRQYRLKRNYSETTIKSQDSYVRKFTAWLTENGMSLQSINYQTVLTYFFQLKEKKVGGQSRKNHLQAMRIYLEYQKGKGLITENPAQNIKLQDKTYKSLLPTIDEETLLNIYKSFVAEEHTNEQRKLQHQRNTVALGLMVFQGLDSGDLERLTIKDINLINGTVYVASSRKNAARTLKLESLQILSIHQYITIQQITEKLFTKSKVNDMVSAIIRKLKPNHPEIENPRHIRSSVIQNWLKKYHIRQVQYMAGHKRVCSTERYKKEDLHDLFRQISKYHPIK